MCVRGPGVSRTNRASHDATSNRGPLGGRPVGLRPSGRETRRHGDEERNIGGYASSTTALPSRPVQNGASLLYVAPRICLLLVPMLCAPFLIAALSNKASASPTALTTSTTTTTTTNIMSTGGANNVAYSGGADTITITVSMTVPTATGTTTISGSTTLTKNVTTPAQAATALAASLQDALDDVGSTAKAESAGRTVLVSGGASTTGTLANPIETPHTPSEAFGRTVSYTP